MLYQRSDPRTEYFEKSKWFIKVVESLEFKIMLAVLTRHLGWVKGVNVTDK